MPSPQTPLQAAEKAKRVEKQLMAKDQAVSALMRKNEELLEELRQARESFVKKGDFEARATAAQQRTQQLDITQRTQHAEVMSALQILLKNDSAKRRRPENGIPAQTTCTEKDEDF